MEIEFGAVTDKAILDYIFYKGSKDETWCFVVVNLLLIIAHIIVAICYDLILLYFIAIYPVELLIVIIYYKLAKPKYDSIVAAEHIRIGDNELESEGRNFYHLRHIEDIKAVYDYGTFYRIVFYFPNKSPMFICQKDAIIKGTIEDFETLFKDYIVKEPLQTKKNKQNKGGIKEKNVGEMQSNERQTETEIEFGAVTDKEVRDYILAKNIKVRLSWQCGALLFATMLNLFFVWYFHALSFLIGAMLWLILLIWCVYDSKQTKVKEKMLFPEYVGINHNDLESKGENFYHLRHIKDVKVIYDCGKYYEIKFCVSKRSKTFICQKDAITKGTIEDFETLFNDYIVRKPIRERKKLNGYFKEKYMSEGNPTFLELLNCHDEFVFSYNGIKYEIVNGDEYGMGTGISLYLSDDKYGTFIRSFAGKDDFLKNAKIEGKSIVEILNKIKV